MVFLNDLNLYCHIAKSLIANSYSDELCCVYSGGVRDGHALLPGHLPLLLPADLPDGLSGQQEVRSSLKPVIQSVPSCTVARYKVQ